MNGHLQAQKIIVIHPGSLNLRIGRAADLNPITLLHAIAYKRSCTDKAQRYHDTLLPKLQKAPEALVEFEEQRLHVSHAIQATSYYEEKGAKRMRIATPPQQISTFNKRSLPEEVALEDDENECKKNEDGKERSRDKLFDRDILSLSGTEAVDYNIHFPIRRGELNLHSDIGGSLTAIMANMEAIWQHALEQYLDIPLSTLSQYSAVLVIPDVYNNRSHLREFVTLLLQKLGFRACFLVQDHVAATFGAGLSYACIVDVGDQKCSISCVEDGISQPDTRVRLPYGGGDVTQIFYTLLKKCSFPYKECDVDENYADSALLIHLKEQFCHLNLSVSGAQEKSFEVKKGGKRLRYTLQLGDECVVAPLSLYYTELLDIIGRKQAIIHSFSSQQPTDPEDCFDDAYIRETGRRNGGRDQLEGTSIPITGEGAPDVDDVCVDDVLERDGGKNTDKEELIYMPNGEIVGLDAAIIRSIEQCGNDDVKRKMYSCILLVGGGVKFSGFAKWLEQKVTLQLQATLTYRTNEHAFEVNTFTKEMDAGMIAWKGAAIMSCLESAPELWIYGGEWEKYGLRILREKAPFIW